MISIWRPFSRAKISALEASQPAHEHIPAIYSPNTIIVSTIIAAINHDYEIIFIGPEV